MTEEMELFQTIWEVRRKGQDAFKENVMSLVLSVLGLWCFWKSSMKSFRKTGRNAKRDWNQIHRL